jgi:hypothetical protein
MKAWKWVGAAGMVAAALVYITVLGWVTVAYPHATSLPWRVNAALGSTIAAFAAFTAMFIFFARKEARENRA